MAGRPLKRTRAGPAVRIMDSCAPRGRRRRVPSGPLFQRRGPRIQCARCCACACVGEGVHILDCYYACTCVCAHAGCTGCNAQATHTRQNQPTRAGLCYWKTGRGEFLTDWGVGCAAARCITITATRHACMHAPCRGMTATQSCTLWSALRALPRRREGCVGAGCAPPPPPAPGPRHNTHTPFLI